MELAEGAIPPRKVAPGEENLAIQVTVTFTYTPDLRHYTATDGYPAAENIAEALGIDLRNIRDGYMPVHDLVPDDGTAHVKLEVVDMSPPPDSVEPKEDLDDADKEALRAVTYTGFDTDFVENFIITGEEVGPVQSGYRQAVQDQAPLRDPEA